MYSKMPTQPKIYIFFRFGLPTNIHIGNNLINLKVEYSRPIVRTGIQ